MFEPGVVVRYFYLWKREAMAGEESGRKSRPVCVVIRTPDNPAALYLFPITSQEPIAGQVALSVPEIECRRAGLTSPSWIVLDEYNFVSTEGLYDFEGLKELGAFSSAFMRRVGTGVKKVLASKKMQRVER